MKTRSALLFAIAVALVVAWVVGKTATAVAFH